MTIDLGMLSAPDRRSSASLRNRSARAGPTSPKATPAVFGRGYTISTTTISEIAAAIGLPVHYVAPTIFESLFSGLNWLLFPTPIPGLLIVLVPSGILFTLRRRDAAKRTRVQAEHFQ